MAITLLNGSSQTILDAIYPVGSIYMSVNSTDPGLLFGGTWARITGAFLLAATDNGNSGASQAAGNTGGAATVTLTAAQSGIPAHAHGLNSHKHSIGAHAHGLNSHVHGLNSHVHGLNSHTHTYNAPNGTNGTAVTANQLPKVSGTIDLRDAAKNVSLATARSGIITYAQTSKDNSPTNLQASIGSNDTRVTVAFGNAEAHSHTTKTTSTNSGAASGNTAAASGNTAAASGNTANSSAFDSDAATGDTATVSAADASAAHENMPPYLSVYIWERTA